MTFAKSRASDGDVTDDSDAKEEKKIDGPEFEMHPVTLTFRDPALEDAYTHYTYIESGFVGGKIYSFMAVVLMVGLLVFFSTGEGPTAESLMDPFWIVHWALGIVWATLMAAIMWLKPLYNYREYLIMLIIATHWPAFEMMNMTVRSPHNYDYCYPTTCYFFCSFISQPRIKRIFVFLTLTPGLTFSLVGFLTDYWDTHSKMEIILWPLMVFPLMLLHVFERKSRRSFASIRACAQAADRLEQKITETRYVIAHFFAPTPTYHLVTSDGQRSTQRYNNVVFIVTDLAGFTAWTSRNPSKAVIGLISKMFSDIDGILNAHGIEKIATVGDAFWGVSLPDAPEGVEPTKGTTPTDGSETLPRRTASSVRFGIAILRFGGELKMRVGIHVGTALLAFVGMSPPKLDVFGDDFEVAKCMEQEGLPNTVHLSHAGLRAANTRGQPGHDAVVTARGAAFATWNETDGALEDVDFDVGYSDALAKTEIIEGKAVQACEALLALATDPKHHFDLGAAPPFSAFSSNVATGALDSMEIHEESDNDEVNHMYLFSSIWLEFEDQDIETRYRRSVKRTDLTKHAATMFIFMFGAIFMAHLLLCCLDSSQNRLVTAAMGFIVLAHISYLFFVGTAHTFHPFILYLTYFTLTALPMMALLSDCTPEWTNATHARSAMDRTTGNVLMLYYLLWSLAPQFVLHFPLKVRASIYIVTASLVLLLVLFRRAVIKDHVLEWDWWFLLNPGAGIFTSYFADFTLRKAYQSRLRLLKILRSTKGRAAESSAKALDVMLPPFVSERLFKAAQALRPNHLNMISEGSTVITSAASSLFGLGSMDLLWEYDACTVMFVYFETGVGSQFAEVKSIILGVERIAAEWSIQKVKTIGSAVMLVAGIENRDETEIARNCLRCIMAGLQAQIQVFGTRTKFKIGIHVGPVVGALLGEQGLIFDVFGDTVNTASRISTAGSPGVVRVSEAVAQYVSGLDAMPFTLTPADPVMAKGKGQIPVMHASARSDDTMQPWSPGASPAHRDNMIDVFGDSFAVSRRDARPQAQKHAWA